MPVQSGYDGGDKRPLCIVDMKSGVIAKSKGRSGRTP